MQANNLPYPIMLQPGGGMYGAPQPGNPWGTPVGFGASLLNLGMLKEEPKQARAQQQTQALDELTIEGQCSHKLAILHFMQNHDIRLN
jgi:hypothetical protein